MRKKPNSKKKLFNLDCDAITHIQEGSKLNNLSQSEFIELLANQWEYSIDPSKKLKYIKSEKESLKKRLLDLEKEEEKLVEILHRKNEWLNKKSKDLPKIVRNVARIIEDGRSVDAEVVAKTQSIRFGIPAIEILTKAMDIVNSGR